MSPRVSVCIPTYQGADFIAEALDSVLASELDDLEVLVLINGSTDETAEILACYDDPRLRVEHNDAVLSLPDNWRRVVELARGRYVKVVSDDDLVSPHAIQIQADVLDAAPDCTLVAHRRDLIDGLGRRLSSGRGLTGLLGRRTGRDVARRLVWTGANPIGEPTNAMFRRSDYLAVGGWDGSLVYPMDIDMWLKLLRRGSLIGAPESLTAFRISSGSLSSGHTRAQYEENAAFIAKVAADPGWQIPAVARWVSAVVRPLGWSAWKVRYVGSNLVARLRRPGWERGDAVSRTRV